MRAIGGMSWREWREKLLDEIIAMHDEPDVVPAWDDETAALISWLEATELPDTFPVNAWTTCIDGGKMRQHLLACAAAGPASGGARAAMRHLHELHERLCNQMAAA